MTRRTSRLARQGKQVDITNTKIASPTDVALAQAPRYRIMSDDSGHEYFVPVDEETWFEGWLLTFEDDVIEENYAGPDYEKNRIDGNFTFTDPRCD